ncbi:MAG: SGNH/GDSL hydrolase family protein [Phycisphaerae bacterium]
MLESGLYGYLGDYLVLVALYASLLIHTYCFFRFFPRERRVKLGLLLGNTLVFLSMLGTVAIVAETHLRFLSVKTDAFGMSLPARRWFVLNTSLNSLGCRDVEWAAEKPPGVRRIAVVGDSFVYGWGVEHAEDRFSGILQARFDARSPGHTEVMNVAKPGWDTGGQIQPVRDMIDRYGVDEVLLGYVANDIEKLLPRSPAFDPIRPPEPVCINITASALADELYRRLRLPRVASVVAYHDWLAEGFADPETWRRHQQQLWAIITYCRDKGVTLRVALLPFLRTRGDKFNAAGLHATLRNFFETNDVPVVDLLPVIRAEPPEALMVNGQDAHPNARAHRLFANAIWQAFYESPAP